MGKSSLLNAVEPGLELRVKRVSTDTQKGRHTTTSARLVRLAQGGYVVDTPGIRQFALWDVIPEEVAGLFRDLRVFVGSCRYPDCTHTHEDDCAVKNAVADDLVDARRYESYFHMVQGGRGMSAAGGWSTRRRRKILASWASCRANATDAGRVLTRGRPSKMTRPNV